MPKSRSNPSYLRRLFRRAAERQQTEDIVVVIRHRPDPRTPRLYPAEEFINPGHLIDLTPLWFPEKETVKPAESPAQPLAKDELPVIVEPPQGTSEEKVSPPSPVRELAVISEPSQDLPKEDPEKTSPPSPIRELPVTTEPLQGTSTALPALRVSSVSPTNSEKEFEAFYQAYEVAEKERDLFSPPAYVPTRKATRPLKPISTVRGQLPLVGSPTKTAKQPAARVPAKSPANRENREPKRGESPRIRSVVVIPPPLKAPRR